MAEQRLRIELSGGGPWGFRLQGGEGQPVTISKVRKRSKADAADIREGDIVVATNGIPCQGRSTTQVMDSIDETGKNVTMELIRRQCGSGNAISYPTLTESRTESSSTIVTRTETLQETRPGGSHSTQSTTVTREQSYSMPQVQNVTAKPFVASSDAGLLLNETDGSVRLTIDTTTKESNIPIFKVKNMAAMTDSTDSWQPGMQDPYQDEILPSQAASLYMDSPQVSQEEFGVAVPKVMPATPGLSAVDIQKLLEPAESPPDTPTQRNMRIYLGSSHVEPSMNRKLYADSAFFDDTDATYPTIEEQVKLAHNVAKILMSEAAVQKSKGSRMFMKKRECAEKYVHEGKEEEPTKGFNIAPGAVTKRPPPEAFYQSLNKEDKIGVWNPLLAAPPPEAPPPPPLMSSRSVEDQRCEHTMVSAEKCFNLAAALHASKGRGGQIFAKRRAKSESWIIDEDNVKSPPPPIVPKAVLRPKNPVPAVRYEKSPWEAAMETGNVENAFSTDKNKRHTIGPNIFNKLPNISNIPRAWSPENGTDQHDFKAEMREKKNFKDFNARPRGWGGIQTSDEDDRRSITSSEGESTRRAPLRMASGNRLSMAYDPRQPVVGRNDLTKALSARGFVAVGNSRTSDL